MKGIKGIFIVHLKATYRSPGELFWLLAWPLLITILFGYIFGGQSFQFNLKVAAINLDQTGSSAMNATLFIQSMNGTDMFTVYEYENLTRAIQDLKDGKVDLITIFPEGFSSNLTSGKTSRIITYIDYANPQRAEVARATLQGFVQAFSEEIQRQSIAYIMQYVNPASFNMSQGEFEAYMWGFAKPINLTESTEQIKSREVSYIEWMVPGIIGMNFLWYGLIDAATAISSERERGTFRRILISPVGPWSVLFGKALGIITNLLVSTCLVVAVSYAVFSVELSWHPIIALVWFLAALNSIGIGLIISSVTKSVRAASGIASTIAAIFQFFIGIYFPREFLPTALQVFGDIFPLTHTTEILRAIMIRETPLTQIIPYLLQTAAAIIPIFLVGVILYKMAARRP